MLHRIWSDAYVVKRVLKGNLNDFQVLVERYGGMVQAVSLAQTGNYTDAEDISQQTFIKAYQSLDSLKEPTKFGAWLCTIARNLAKSSLRKKRPDVNVEDVSESALISDSVKPATKELHEMLRAEIENMEPTAREVLLLYYFGGERIAQVARVQDVSEEAVKKRLQRARQALGQRLEQRVGELFGKNEAKRQNRAIMGGIAAANPGWYSATTASVLSKGVVYIACGAVVGIGGLAYWANQPAQESTVQPVESPLSSNSIIATESPFETTANKTETSTSSLDATDAAPVLVESNEEEEQTPPSLPDNVVGGKVSDETGTPVVDAIVWAVRGYSHSPRIVAETKTGEDGSFYLKLDKGSWFVMIRKGMMFGHPTGSNNGYVTLNKERPNAQFDVILQPAGRLTGRLLDEATGKPIVGGKLWLDQGVELTTDSDGKFHYEGIPAGDHVIAAITPGYERRRYLFDTSMQENAAVVLRTRPGGAVYGRVIDEEGNPIPNASVGNTGSGKVKALQARFAATDRDGSFVRDGMVFGFPYRLKAFAEGYEESPRQYVSVHEDIETKDLVFVLKKISDTPEAYITPGAIDQRFLSGTVLDEEGAPLEDVEVRWLSSNLYDYTETVSTNADGKFEIPEADDREGYVLAETETYVPLLLPVTAGELKNLELKLNRGMTMNGRVVDAKGQAIEGAYVMRRKDERGKRTLWFTSWRTVTDENGAFEIQGLDPALPIVDILKQGYTNIRELKLSAEENPQTITMLAGGALAGRVELPDGSPAQEFAILVKSTSIAKDNSGSMYAGYRNIGIHFAESDGYFVVSDIPAGRDYKLVATAHGYADAVLDPVRAITLDTVHNSEGVTLRLAESKPFYSYIGHANDPDTPVVAARGVLLDRIHRYGFSFPYDEYSWTRSIRRRPDAQGNIDFGHTGFSEGTYLIKAPGFANQVHEWTSDTESINIYLEPEARVYGTATNKYGEAIIDGRCSLTATYGETRQTRSFSMTLSPDAPGQFMFDGLPAGKYTLQITQGDETQRLPLFSLKAGEIKNLDEE